MVALILFTWITAAVEFRTRLIGSSPLFTLEDGSFKAIGQSEGATLKSVSALELIKSNSNVSGGHLSFNLKPASIRLIKFKADLRRIGKELNNSVPSPAGTLIFLRFDQGKAHPKYRSVLRTPRNVLHTAISDIALVPASANSMTLGFHGMAEGHWVLENVRFDQVELSQHYYYARAALVILWMLLCICAIRRNFSRRTLWYLLPFALGVGGVLAATLASQTYVALVVRPMIGWFTQYMPSLNAVNVNDILDYGHAVMFLFLTLLFLALRRMLNSSLLKIVIICTLLAAASEAIQRHSFSRTAQLSDLALDILGIAIALIIFTALYSVRHFAKTKAD